MANKQPSKNDKKHRKLTKSPQVSCDMSMLSSSSPIHSGFSLSSFPSPKYIAYPSSLPNHLNDESLKKNFEYSRADLSLTSPDNSSSSSAIPITPTSAYTTIPSPKRSDEPNTTFQRYTNLSVKNHPEPHRTNSDHIHRPANERDLTINTRVQHQQYEPVDQQTNFLYLTNQMTIPTCCLKNSQQSSTTTTTNDGIKTSPSSSTVFNDHLRQLKQLFQSSNSNSQNANKNQLNSSGNENSCSLNNNQKTPFSTTTKEHLPNENINHTNPFIFGNIFKSSNDKSTTTENTGQTSSSISTSNTNPFLSENIKRDEFLKATMKVHILLHINVQLYVLLLLCVCVCYYITHIERHFYYLIITNIRTHFCRFVWWCHPRLINYCR